ncbi:MAG: DUF4150 domain-containing protein [Deltaproteobacteria bacterium]|nr:DUF4150 domain-containing protein [Deltaproteobacteria bacterium]
MFPIATKSGGMAFAFPDVCKVPAPPAPPVPTPFPNTGQNATALLTSLLVKIANMPALTTMSEIPTSQGDETGVGGGVMSGVNMNKVTFRQGSTCVLVEGSPVVCQLNPTAHNGTNANAPMGMVQTPGQVLVVVSK